VTIGNTSIARTRTFDGVLDELRLEHAVRSDEWSLVQHQSGRDQLVTFGDEEPGLP